MRRRRLKRKRTRYGRELFGASEIRLEASDGFEVLALPVEAVERYRLLHTRLVREESLPRRLGLLAALRQEGVTFVSLSLGAVMAHDLERRFCIVELNMWWPGLWNEAHLDPFPGVGEVLIGEASLEDALRPTAMENLWLLPSGYAREASRARLARGGAMRDLLARLDEQFDCLLLDIPAVLATNDAPSLAAWADALCLVVRQGVTPLPLIRQALDEIEHLPVSGVVLNGERLATPAWLRRLIFGVEAL